MKTGNIFLAALILTVLGASSCATLDRAAVEQEELITQIQWENEAMGDGD
jgi:hypothetical protein